MPCGKGCVAAARRAASVGAPLAVESTSAVCKVGAGTGGAAAKCWRARVHQGAAACHWATMASGMSPVAACRRGQYSQLLYGVSTG